MVIFINRWLATEECSRKRDPEQAALTSMITTVRGRFDLHLSVLSRLVEAGAEKTSASLVPK